MGPKTVGFCSQVSGFYQDSETPEGMFPHDILKDQGHFPQISLKSGHPGCPDVLLANTLSRMQELKRNSLF